MLRGMKEMLALCCVLALCGCGSAGRGPGSNRVEDTIQKQIDAAETDFAADAPDASEDSSTRSDEMTQSETEEDNTSEKEITQDNLTEVSESVTNPQENGTEPEQQEGFAVDVDLTQMNSDMVYSTVYQMMNEPESYAGKTVKMEGKYYATWYEPTEQYYYYVMIADAAACCSQGLEFVWEDGTHDKDEYPEDGKELTVVGIFDTYDEEVDGKTYTYCHLKQAEILDESTFVNP